MFKLDELSTTDRQNNSPYISYGAGQVLRINDIELKVSQNTGSPKAIFHMEGKPIDEEGFTPVEGAKGKVGKIACGIYMKTDDQKKDFLKKLKSVAIALDLESEINEVSGDSFEEVVDGCKDVICGVNKWARYTIFGEQYPKQDGRIGIKLALPRYNFVESIDTTEDTSKLVKFDISNPMHFKKVDLNELNKIAGENLADTSDLPF